MLAGSEELCDHRAGLHEWTSIAVHRRWLPKSDVPPAAFSARRELTYDKTTDAAVWAGKPIQRRDPLPE